jgi:hypothetical protein
MHPPHERLHVCLPQLGDIERVQLMLRAPGQEDLQVGGRVDSGLTLVPAQVTGHSKAQDPVSADNGAVVAAWPAGLSPLKLAIVEESGIEVPGSPVTEPKTLLCEVIVIPLLCVARPRSSAQVARTRASPHVASRRCATLGRHAARAARDRAL